MIATRTPAAALAVLAVLAASLAVGVAAGRAADECRGLQVCLPLAGPWVAIPTAGGPVDYLLACPRKGYIVAGTDVRISDRQIDVGLRGDTGSPVGPGTTTRESVVFSGLYAGAAPRRTSFQPFIGCIPTSGGGSRNQTAHSAGGEGLKPTRPVDRLAVARKLPGGSTRVVARCPGTSRLVRTSHAIGFRTPTPPTDAALAAVTAAARVAGNTITVTAVVGPAAVGSNPELQVLALCTKTGR